MLTTTSFHRHGGRSPRLPALGLAAALLLGTPLHGETLLPTSNVRVQVSSAGVTGLDCRRRAFRMEFSRDIGLRYRSVAGQMFNRNVDPYTLVRGFFALILMAPLAVLAPPADLVAAPWRRECGFDLWVQGRLRGWAGSSVADAPLGAEGASMAEAGVEDIVAPRYVLTRATATADGEGRFAVSLPGRVGPSPQFELRWLVDSLPSGKMSLRKRGSRFILSEPEPEFGSSADTMAPLEIQPGRER
ncbi:MAG: hypothetical protein NTY77_07075 [Elusimicrobia bacterium]|nr:hypothetical protein [Elusimicrobiota bacterium]